MGVSELTDTQILERHKEVSSVLAKRLTAMEKADRIQQSKRIAKVQKINGGQSVQRSQETEKISFSDMISRIIMASNTKSVESINEPITPNLAYAESLKISQSTVERLVHGWKK